MGDDEGSEPGLHHWGDIITLAGYFLLTLSVGIWSICRPTRKSVKGYFLADQNAPWWAAGLSLFASNISSEHFIGFAGAGAASGIAIALFEWNAIFLVLLLAWVFLPVYIIAGVYTLPEYLMLRFGGHRLRVLLAIVFLMSTVLVPADLYSGGIFIQQALGWNIYLAILLIIAVSGLYTILGGLATVMYTDVIQVFIMLAGSCAVLIIAMVKVGGFGALKTKYMEAVPTSLVNSSPEIFSSNFSQNYNNSVYDVIASCGLPRDDAWHLFRHPITADYPSVAVLLRMTFGALFFWCAHQTIVQRVLAAKNMTHAKGAAILAGSLKLTPFILMIVPGMVSRVLYTDEVACVDPDVCQRVCGSRAGCSNIAYPKLVLTLLPVGLRGLMLSTMLSAVISSLTSIYNSVATVVTLDLWCKVRPRSTERELLLVGRLSVVVVLGISVAWVPVLQDADGGQMIRYITAVFGYLGAPISAVFIVAMFWPRATEPGAFYGFVAAVLCGMVRFALDTIYRRVGCGQTDTRPYIVAKIHPYYFSAIQVLVGILFCAVITLFTKPRTKEQLAGVTFWTRNQLSSSDSSPTEEQREMTERTPPNDDVIRDFPSDVTNATHDVTQEELDTETTPRKSHWKGREFFTRIRRTSSVKSEKRHSVYEKDNLATRQQKLQEPRSTRIILNTAAILLMFVVLALYVYFR